MYPFVAGADGQEVLHVSFEGVVTERIYDAATGRLAEKLFFDNLDQYNEGTGTPSEVWTFTFDAFGRQVEVE